MVMTESVIIKAFVKKNTLRIFIFYDYFLKGFSHKKYFQIQ